MKTVAKIALTGLCLSAVTSCAPRLPGMPRGIHPRHPRPIVVTPNRRIPRAPKPKREVIPKAPFSGAVWVPGVWKWNGRAHVWTPGYYKGKPPKGPGKSRGRGHAKGHDKKKGRAW